MKNNIVTIAIGILSIVLVGAVVAVIAGEDKTGPVITFNSSMDKELTYTSGEDRKKLIACANATDAEDGDVSDSIMIEDIYIMSDLSAVKVIYVARDKNNNITKADKIIRYIASQEEIDAMNKQNAEISSETVTSAKVSTETKAQESTTKVLNTETPVATSAKPVLTLSKNEVTITQGDSFSAISYVKDIVDDKDSRSILFTRINVSGSYDAKSPGDYTMNIFCTDTEGNVSNTEKLVLHVTAKVEETEAQKETVTEKAETKQQTVAR